MLIQRPMNRHKHRDSLHWAFSPAWKWSPAGCQFWSEPAEWLRVNGGRSSVRCTGLEPLSAFNRIIKLQIKHENFMNSQCMECIPIVVISLNSSVTDTSNNCRFIGSENINFRQNRSTLIKISVLIRWLTYEIDAVCFLPASLFHLSYFF